MKTPEDLAHIVHVMMDIRGTTLEQTLEWALLKEELYDAYDQEEEYYDEETIMARLSGVPEHVILKLESYDRDQRLTLLQKIMNAYQTDDYDTIKRLEVWELRKR